MSTSNSSESAAELSLTSERKESEQVLLKSLMLRSYLEGVASLDETTGEISKEGEIFETQQKYTQMHQTLDELSEQITALTRKKVEC